MARGAAATAALAALALGACAQGPGAQTPVATGRRHVTLVGVFDDYNEVARGSIVSDSELRLHFMDFEGLVSGIRCVGHGAITHMPAGADPPHDCRGVRGRTRVTCTDEREVEVELRIDPDCRVGYGSGQDQGGHTLSFVYGLPEDRLEAAVRAELARSGERPALPAYHPAETRAQQGFSTGTAFAVSADGHLVTSEHVVHGASEIWLVDAAGRTHRADYVGGDEENDVAVLRLRELRPRPVPIAGADTIAKGEQVFTLGYPLVQLQGQAQKATFGRVNALSGASDDERFLQVDVPIQPGNSGGPLLDMQGRVIGVVTATLDQVTSFRAAGVIPQNVNYAIRSDFVLAVLEDELGEAFAPAAPRDLKDPKVLIPEIEDSVLLVVAR